MDDVVQMVDRYTAGLRALGLFVMFLFATGLMYRGWRALSSGNVPGAVLQLVVAPLLAALGMYIGTFNWMATLGVLLLVAVVAALPTVRQFQGLTAQDDGE